MPANTDRLRSINAMSGRGADDLSADDLPAVDYGLSV
jgi:hypothetical protein